MGRARHLPGSIVEVAVALTRKEVASLATDTSMIGLSEEFVRDFLRDECVKAGGQAKWAKANGLSAAYVNDVLHGRRDPGDSICAPLGLRRQVTYLYDHDRATAAEAKRTSA